MSNILRCFLLTIFSFYFLSKTKAQTSNISGIINDYASVTSIGSQSIILSNAIGFAVGDRVLLIQMKGAEIDTTNTSAFGTINSYHDAGNYEMLTISSISATTVSFSTPILRTYNTIGLVQLVRVPVYNNVNVTGILTCSPWNGITGGVLALEATGNIILNANIDVTGRGFLGGAKLFGQLSSCIGNTSDFKLSISSLYSSSKGEGITVIKPSYAKGLGALANGGGSGNDANGGGAGGGNYGLGGHGGNAKCSTFPNSICGGYEGENCIYSNINNKIFLGGGGGAGHENDGVSTGGVSGGGVIVIRTGGSILGNGNFIMSNGNDNLMLAGNDGQGGGGAGGTVLIDACSTSSLTISVKGGNGGTDNFSGPDCHGKGGGGGGGIIWTSSTLSYNSFLNGGNPGVFTNPASQCFNTSNGATTGQSGGTLTGLVIPGAIPLVANNSFTLNTSSSCVGNNATASGTLTTTLASPVISYTWINSSGAIISQTNNTVSLVNSVSNLTNGIYTLSVTLTTPCGTLTGSQTLTINCVATPTQPCGGSLTGTGMSVCNQYSFSITPSQTITPLNYGNQGYVCNGTTQPDVSFNIMGSIWRVNKYNWFFTPTVSGQVSGYNSSGVLQTFPFSATNTITPLSYSGSYIQFAVNGVATGSLLSQTNFSISLNPVLFGSNSYTYCSSTATSIAISPIIPSSGGPWSYNWIPGSLSGSTVSVSPSVSTVYTVTAISTAGCASSTTIAVTETCVSTPTAPQCPGSLLFDAAHPAVDLPSGNQYYSGINGGYTWECWFKLNQPFGTDMRPLISAVDGVLYEDQWFGFGWQGGWFNEPVTKLVFKVDGPNSIAPTGPNCAYAPPGGFQIGTWYHAAGVMNYTTQTSKLFLNGVLVDSKPITTSPITRVIPEQLCLNWGGTPLPLYGNMDEVRIWERAVTDAEILANYDHCLTGNEQNLLVYYRCNQPGGTTVIDATPNNNTGAFSNLPSWSTQQPSITGTACATSLPILTSSSSNSVICAGTTVTLSVSGVTSYTWNTGVTNSDIIVTPAATTIYTVTTDLSACSGTTLSSIITVSVVPPPTISITSSYSVFCSNQTNTLTASGANSYTWSSSPSLSSTTGSLVTTTPIINESYTIIGAIGNCTNSAIYSLTVNPSPTVTIASLSSTVCSGQSTTLTANGANTYTWSSGATLSNSSGSIAVVSPLSTSNYAVIGTLNSCTNSAVATVSVLPTPTVTVSSNTSICLGTTISSTLTANGANAYSWSNSATLSSSTGSVVIASPNTTTVYTVTGTFALCSNTAAITVNVNASPTITAVTFTNTSCGLNNGAILVTSSPTNNTYTWSAGITSTTNTASSLTSGTYSVTLYNGSCQTTTVVNILSSSPLQITSSTITPSDCILNNGSITVNDNYVNSNYSWSPNISSTNNAINLYSGNYALTITNGACSTSSVFVISQLNGPTALNVSQSNAICESINGSINIINVTNGIAPYQYDFNNTGFSSITTYSNLAQGVYTITVKDARGCLFTQTFTIDKSLTNLTMDLITNSPSCNDNYGSYIINRFTSGSPPYFTSFNNGAYSSNLVFDQLGIGTYSLSIRDSNMCETGYVLTMQENGDYTLYIPNTFTPNNNKVNDVWYVKGTCLDEFNCLIFNRWGEKIKELTDIKEGWDGTYKGNPVPDGVYVYIIEAKAKKEVFKKSGHITVSR